MTSIYCRRRQKIKFHYNILVELWYKDTLLIICLIVLGPTKILIVVVHCTATQSAGNESFLTRKKHKWDKMRKSHESELDKYAIELCAGDWDDPPPLLNSLCTKTPHSLIYILLQTHLSPTYINISLSYLTDAANFTVCKPLGTELLLPHPTRVLYWEKMMHETIKVDNF